MAPGPAPAIRPDWHGPARNRHERTVPNDDPFPTLAVNCIDYGKTIASFADFAAMTRRGRKVAPHTQGANEACLGITGCMQWPVPLAKPPHRDRVRGAPPSLLVSLTHDPSTPYVGAPDPASDSPRRAAHARGRRPHLLVARVAQPPQRRPSRTNHHTREAPPNTVFGS
jgi:hypothetical protein